MANLLDLPTELIHIIVEQLHVSNHYRTLKSLRLTCKLLCRCIDPVLFSTVNINLHHLTRATSLLEAFATERSTVNRFAKHLEIMSLEQRYEGHDVNAIHAAWSNFKASKYICSAIQTLENVESVEFHVCKYNPHSSSVAVMEALTVMPSITTLRLTEDFGTVWRDIRFDLFTTIVDLSINASTGYFIEQNLPNFMVNNPCLERLCIKFFPGYGRLGWSLDLNYLFSEVLKEPMALRHMELHGRWKLSSSSCMKYLPCLSSLCLSEDDDGGKSMGALLSSLSQPLRRLALPNGAREGGYQDSIFQYLQSYSGLSEFTVGPSGLPSSTGRLRDALSPHRDSLTKLTWEPAMFTCHDFDFAAISQLRNLQSLSITLISSMKNLVMGEVVIATADSWLDMATSLPCLGDLDIEVIRRPRSHLYPCEDPMETIDQVITQFAIKSDSCTLRVHTLSNCYRNQATYKADGKHFVPLHSSKGGVGLEREPFTSPPCRPDFGDGGAPLRLWGAAIASFCLGYWFEAYPSGISLLAMAAGCFVVTLGLEVVQAIQSSNFESALLGRLTSMAFFL